MKKIIISSLTLLASLVFLLFPSIASLQAHDMQMHDGGNISCVEHCLGEIGYFSESTGFIVSSFEELLVVKVLLQIVQSFTLNITSLYILLFLSSAFLFRKIKNYSYHLLIGIIISTT